MPPNNWNITYTSQEGELLFACSRTHIDNIVKNRIINLADDKIDWQHLVKIARYNRVMPLLHHGLEITCRDAVPNKVFDDLTNDVKQAIEHSQENLTVILGILKLFNANQIPPKYQLFCN